MVFHILDQLELGAAAVKVLTGAIGVENHWDEMNKIVAKLNNIRRDR